MGIGRLVVIAPAESTTRAVTTCSPAGSSTVIRLPTPSGPTRSETHSILALRLPSSGFDANAWNVTASPDDTVVWGWGCVTTSEGRALTSSLYSYST
jgi:hypothetical protein